MTENRKKIFLSWFVLTGFLTLALVFQTTLWPETLRARELVPQLTLPVLLYFSLHTSLIFTLSLFYAVSVLSTGFMAIPFANIFIAYLCLYIPTIISREFYQWREFRRFFVVCFLQAAFFPTILDLLSRFSVRPHFTAPPFHLIVTSALLTSFCGAVLYPSLKRAGVGLRNYTDRME